MNDAPVRSGRITLCGRSARQWAQRRCLAACSPRTESWTNPSRRALQTETDTEISREQQQGPADRPLVLERAFAAHTSVTACTASASARHTNTRRSETDPARPSSPVVQTTHSVWSRRCQGSTWQRPSAAASPKSEPRTQTANTPYAGPSGSQVMQVIKQREQKQAHLGGSRCGVGGHFKDGVDLHLLPLAAAVREHQPPRRHPHRDCTRHRQRSDQRATEQPSFDGLTELLPLPGQRVEHHNRVQLRIRQETRPRE